MPRARTTALLTLLTAASALSAGPLAPPAGAVAPTMKTIQQAEPRTPLTAETTPGDAAATFVITAPGSYYLTADLNGQDAKTGIRVEAHRVTIDLNGFSIWNAKYGVLANNRDNVTVRNGVIQNVDFDAVSLTGSFARIEDVQVIVTGGNGFTIGDLGYIARSLVYQANQTGVRAGPVARIVETTCLGNLGKGFELDSRATLTECNASSNVKHGFLVGSYTRMDRCVASDNSGAGVYAIGTTNITLDTCEVNRNGDGGIRLGDHATVRNSTASHNNGWGMSLGAYAVADHNQANDNAVHGITIQAESVATHNTCNRNGTNGDGAGISASWTSCRIEDNHLNYNDYGVYCTGSDIIIVRNSARGNTSGNFSVTPGNELAPVITNPGSNAFATATPWSNFAY